MLNFTTVGKPFTDGQPVAEIIGGLTWIETKGSGPVSFSTGALIQEVIAQLPGGRVTHFAEGVLGRLGLVAVRREGFKGGPVNIYLVDEGAQTTVIASEQMAEAA